MTETFHLQRFLEAQAPVYRQVLKELEAGRKQSHWMWFIFPQIAGLGFSATAQRYAIVSGAEAEAYLAHPVIGYRLLKCTRLMLAHAGQSAHQILGSPDDIKFCSCMTLFAECSKKGSPFEQALHVFYNGQRDEKTIALLSV